MLPGVVFDFSILDTRPGFAVLHFKSKKDLSGLLKEAGGHRWQRVSPTEKKGRVHTSTITVAVLPVPSATEVKIDQKDLEIRTCRGHGAGGQHRNVTDSAVQILHKPSGILVVHQNERSQHANKTSAMVALRAKLLEQQKQQTLDKRNAKRKGQLGSGMRGDKRRTIRVRDNKVKDHQTGKTMAYKEYARGAIDKLW